MQAMTTAAAAFDGAERPQSWLGFLRAELAPTPGRLNATVRIVVATTIVLITSMALQVPSADLSLFIVIFVTMLAPGAASQNTVAVAIASIAAVVVLTLTIALTLLVGRFTMDYPPLRLAAMALGFFLAMYAFRVFAAPAVGFIIAIVFLVTQAAVDLFPGPEAFVRGTLWIWVAIAYPAAVAVGVNLLLLPADPEPLLRREVAARLRAAARAMAAPFGSTETRDAAASLAAFAQQGSAPLLKLLKLAQIRDSSLAPLRAERTAKLQLVQRLVESAALLADLAVEPAPGERARLASLAAECERLAAAVSTGVRPMPAPPASGRDGDARSALAPVLAELERTVRELPVAERPEADEPGRSARLFVPDALTNPRYAQFALKATMAAMLCYIAYTAVDWPGIHTCMITCVIVALGSAGATIQKATLRLVGCAIGGSLALASIVFVVPHMTSIAQLALLVAAVTAPAAWIAMGSERTAYVGLQLAFAFYLAVLQGFEPSTDVTEARDRFVGIVFGISVMALVFAYVWPERAGTSMVQSLVAALRRMAELARGAGDPRAPRAAAWQSIAEAERLAELSAFEPEALAPPGAERGERAGGLIDLARRVLLVQAALVQPATGRPAAGAGRAAFGGAVAEALDAVANRLDTGATVPPADLRSPLAALGAGTRQDGELALCEALTDRVEALQRAAGVA
jgi:multidrug resistance protein MdtO